VQIVVSAESVVLNTIDNFDTAQGVDACLPDFEPRFKLLISGLRIFSDYFWEDFELYSALAGTGCGLEVG